MKTLQKQKKLDRLQVVNFIKNIHGIKESHQEAILGKNFYLIGDDKDEPDFQLEFIPQSKKYFYTIYLRGLKYEADNIHEEILNFLRKLELNRNIVLDTETQTSIVKQKNKKKCYENN